MLEVDYQRQLASFLESTPLQIDVPLQWKQDVSPGCAAAPRLDDRRRFARFTFPTRAVLETKQSLPAIERAERMHHVLTKDLSRNGIGILHIEQLFPEERLILWLPTGKQQFVVTRCRRVNPRCYEIGARVCT